MAAWKHHIKIGHIFHDDGIPYRRKGQLIASILRRKVLPSYDGDDDFIDIIEGFEDILEVDTEGLTAVEDFDASMEELYDWGDWGHRLWVDTFTKGATDG